MSAQPLMPEKMRRRVEAGASVYFLEPDEELVCSVPNQVMPIWLVRLLFGGLLALAIAPFTAQKSSAAVLTNYTIYVFKTSYFAAFKPLKVLYEVPLGSASARIGGSAFPGRYLELGEHKIWLHPKHLDRAQAILAANADRAARGSARTAAE